MITSLEIKNFRSLQEFKVKKLGRVNLIVGKNNSGKSSVLEALRIYAGNANVNLLQSISEEHDEEYLIDEIEHQGSADVKLPFEDFFTGRSFPNDDTEISIGEVDSEVDVLKIKHACVVKETFTLTEDDGEKVTRIKTRILKKSELEETEGEVLDAIIVSKGNGRDLFFIELNKNELHRRRIQSKEEKNSKPCSYVPTQFISMDELAEKWDEIIFTEAESVIKDALKIILPDFENLGFVENKYRRLRRVNSINTSSRKAVVKISGIPGQVPLNSLGDGMLRVLQLVLKAFSAKNGFLLIDEFENGLHYSVQEKIWSLLFELSNKLNIQVFATTHSWDCIESFSKVSLAKKDIDGVLFRIGKSIRKSENNKVIATVFDEDQLYNITQSDVEVR